MFTRSVVGEFVAPHSSMRALLIVLLALAAPAALPVAASAVTIDQVVAMSKAGVSERVILAMIERDNTIFNIEPEQVVTLQRQGVSESVILALLRGANAASDQAAPDAARAALLAAAPVAPEVAIVGHGPDVPNVSHFGYPVYPAAYPFPGFAPALIPVPVPYALPPRTAVRHDLHRDRAMCLAQTTGAGRPNGALLSWITECPAAMQPSLGRSIR